MADPFVAEIRIFCFNFAPHGWAFCDGQLLPLSQNTALFSLLGTTYGGDGRSTFALPDLQDLAPMHPGQGPGLSLHDLGEVGGSEFTSLITSELPAHVHTVNAAQFPSSSSSPDGMLARSRNAEIYRTSPSNPVLMSFNSVSTAGGGQPHNNMMPYLTVNFCIALQGVFPPRT